jgi:hypothetical protein
MHWSPATTALRATGIDVSGAITSPISPEALKPFLTPLENDPLSFQVSDILLSSAEGRNVNLVADLSDQLFQNVGMNSRSRPTHWTPTARAFTNAGETVTESAGWTVMAPTDPITARRDRLDRRVLNDYVRALVKDQRVSLDARAALAAGSDPEGSEWITRLLTKLILPDAVTPIDNLDRLRIYAGLGPAEKSAPRKTLAVKALNESQRNALQRLIYDSEAGLTYTYEMPGGGMVRSQGGATNLAGEPTEALPNGIPPDGTLDLTLSQEFVVALPSNVPAPFRADPTTYTSQSLAAALYRAERGANRGITRADLAQSRPGNSTTWTFAFHLSPTAESSFTLADNTLGASIPYEKLPEAFRKEVETKLGEIRQANGGGR